MLFCVPIFQKIKLKYFLQNFKLLNIIFSFRTIAKFGFAKCDAIDFLN